MDARRFDEMTRVLAAGRSRRRVLAGAAAGLAAALGLGRRPADAQSVCRPYGRTCSGLAAPPPPPFASGFIPIPTECCTPGAICRCYPNGHCRCVCPEGSSLVNGACVGSCAAPRFCPGSGFPGQCCPEGCSCIGGGSCLCIIE